MTDNSGPNSQHAAKVQVLTAEVRTLMVGSRQVTLSVYEQLDFVKPEEIEPFGRVSGRKPHCNDGWNGISRDCPGDCIDVVGRDLATGALVRSCERGWHVNGRKVWSDLPLIVLAGLR